MSSDPSAIQRTSSAIKCGACGNSNPPEAKFCEECGQALFEDCYSCDKPVMLTQKFCGACGTDLEKNVIQRAEQYDAWMTEAVGLAKELSFDQAIRAVTADC